MKKLAILLVFVLALLPIGNAFAQDDVATPASTEDQVQPISNNGEEITQPVSASDTENTEPEIKKLFEINDTNFPSSQIKKIALQYDGDGDGWINQEEHDYFSRFEFSFYDGVTLLDFRGLEHFKNIQSVSLYGHKNFKLSFKNIEVLEKLPLLQRIDILNVPFSDELQKLNLPSLTDLSTNEIISLSDLKNFKNLQYMKIQGLKENNLSDINLLSKLQRLDIAEASNIKSIDIPAENNSLKELIISHSGISDIKGIKKYKNLNYIQISGGTISDLSNIDLENLGNLQSIYITEQKVKSQKGFIVGSPFIADDVTLPKEMPNSNSYTNIHSENATIENNLITWNLNQFQGYNLGYNQNFQKPNSNDTVIINYNAKVYNITPIDYTDSTWLTGISNAIFEESFKKDNKDITVFREFNYNLASHFKNIFLTDGVSYAYSYHYGNDSTSRVYVFDDETKTSMELYPQNIQWSAKRENGKYYLKSTAEYMVDTSLIRKEEVSYIKDDGVVHEVTYTNLSDTPVSNIKFLQRLDTMLNEDDAVPIYADGKGNSYIVAPSFTLYLQHLGDKGSIMTGTFGDTPTSENTKNASEYSKGTLLLDEVDTAIYYATDAISLAGNQSYSYSYKETIYTQVPTIKAEDKTINVNDKWDPLEQLIGVYDEDGNELDKAKVQVTHNVDVTKAGVYEVTYTYNNIYSKTVKLTVVGESVKAKKPKAPNTSDNMNLTLYVCLLSLSILSLVVSKKLKNIK